MTTRQLHDQGEWLIQFLLANLVGKELPAIAMSPDKQTPLKIIDFEMAVPVARIFQNTNDVIINHIDSQHRIDLLMLLEANEKKFWLPIEIKLGKNFKDRKVEPDKKDFLDKIGSVSNILSHHSKKSSPTLKSVNFLLPARVKNKGIEAEKSWGLLLRNGCSEVKNLKPQTKEIEYTRQNIDYVLCLHCIYEELKNEKLKEKLIPLILGDHPNTLADELLGLLSALKS